MAILYTRVRNGSGRTRVEIVSYECTEIRVVQENKVLISKRGEIMIGGRRIRIIRLGMCIVRCVWLFCGCRGIGKVTMNWTLFVNLAAAMQRGVRGRQIGIPNVYISKYIFKEAKQ